MTRQLTHKMRLGVGLVIVLMSIVGCFQQATQGASIATPVSQDLPTSTSLPTNTALPVTATFTPTMSPAVTDATAIAFALTETETPSPEATQVAQESTIDPLIQEATDLIATQTQEIIDLTQTAQITVQPPTATPTSQFPATATLTPPGVDVPSTGVDCIHQIQPGDNLYRLSIYYGLPIRTLQSANGITNAGLIIAGRNLNIPGCGTTGNRPPPTIPGVSQPGGGVTLPNGSAGGITHIVEQGETLYQLSVRYNVLIRDIQAANGISNANLIYFDQRLIIP